MRSAYEKTAKHEKHIKTKANKQANMLLVFKVEAFRKKPNKKMENNIRK